MSALMIDADALFRAVTSHDFQLLAYYLDLRSGAITTRTLGPDEVKIRPRGPSVPPLPVLGGDVQTRKGEAPFGGAPVEVKKDLFGAEPQVKQDPFSGDFWKKEGGTQQTLFRDGGHRRESGTRKLAELFGEGSRQEKVPDPFGSGQGKGDGNPRNQAVPGGAAGGAPRADGPGAQSAEVVLDLNDPLQRIPPASEEQVLAWHSHFARECGDPKIREALSQSLHKGRGKALDQDRERSFAAFERVLRRYQRMEQQWRMYYRKQALHYGCAWLQLLPVQWELKETGGGPAV